jgi:hypothetical protein
MLSPAAALPVEALTQQLSLAAHALSSRLQSTALVAPAPAPSHHAAHMNTLLQDCLRLLQQVKQGGKYCSALQTGDAQQQQQQVDEISREMRGEYV